MNIFAQMELIKDIFFDRSDASRRRMPSVKPKSREKWRRRGGRSRRRRDRWSCRGRLSEMLEGSARKMEKRFVGEIE